MASPAVFNSVLSIIAFVRFCRFQCNFFFFKVGLFYVSLINWVVKPLLKNSTQSDNDSESVMFILGPAFCV